jgi:hypothetical protein
MNDADNSTKLVRSPDSLSTFETGTDHMLTELGLRIQVQEEKKGKST